MTKKKRERRTFTAELKHQMVQLYQNGKPRKDIIIGSVDQSKSYVWLVKEKDNKTAEQLELEALRKQNKQLLMEIDILKQAALILGRK